VTFFLLLVRMLSGDHEQDTDGAEHEASGEHDQEVREARFQRQRVHA
jgi:hypothetical protein